MRSVDACKLIGTFSKWFVCLDTCASTLGHTYVKTAVLKSSDFHGRFLRAARMHMRSTSLMAWDEFRNFDTRVAASVSRPTSIAKA